MTAAIQIPPEVRHALEAGRAVVAVETAVTTTGLPRQPLEGAPPGDATGWDRAVPTNLETARLLERLVCDGAVFGYRTSRLPR